MFRKLHLFVVSLMSFQAKAQEKKTQIYLDDSQPIEPRVEDALSKMTLEEKKWRCFMLSQNSVHQRCSKIRNSRILDN